MILFTIHDIRTLIQMLAQEMQVAEGGASHADLVNPDSDLWLRAIQRLVDQVCNDEVALGADQANPLKGSNLASAEAGNPMNMGVSEAARYLRVSPNTIYRWTSQGKNSLSKGRHQETEFL